MSLKSFDDFCAKIINTPTPVPEKDIFDERQTIVRAQLTTKALWAFVITSGINLLIMECGPQWCESRVLSTAFFGAAAYLYWVCANARRGSLFSIHGTATLSSQVGFLFGDSVFIPIAILSDKEPNDVIDGFFIRNGMVSDYFMIALNGALLLTSGIVMAACIGNHRKREKAEKENDDR